MYHQHIDKVTDIKKFYHWFEKTLIAEEQVLSTRAIGPDAGCAKRLQRQSSTQQQDVRCKKQVQHTLYRNIRVE